MGTGNVALGTGLRPDPIATIVRQGATAGAPISDSNVLNRDPVSSDFSGRELLSMSQTGWVERHKYGSKVVCLEKPLDHRHSTSNKSLDRIASIA